MKKVLLVLAMFVAITSISFADGGPFNPAVNEYATFTGTVIAPLAWDNTSNATLDLPNGVAGQDRPLTGQYLEFSITGQAGKNVTITNHFDIATSGDGGTVTLDYTWLYPDGTYALTGGTLTQKFTVNKIMASDDAHGSFVWTIYVDAVYTGL